MILNIFYHKSNWQHTSNLCKTVVSPVHEHWRYHSLALRPPYVFFASSPTGLGEAQRQWPGRWWHRTSSRGTHRSGLLQSVARVVCSQQGGDPHPPPHPAPIHADSVEDVSEHTGQYAAHRLLHIQVRLLEQSMWYSLLKPCANTEGKCEHRDHSVYVPSQWEMPLNHNAISHRLGAYTDWSLWTHRSAS